ncbi:MAG: BatB protein, partial [Gammaproteobacteria bacterium]|nr:BatB protein [Gammaproteobacteria bacterium]
MNILTDITFSLPWLFLILPLPLLVMWLMPRASSSQPEAIRVPFFEQIQSQQVQQINQTSRLWLILAIIIWALLVTSAARPQSIDEPIQLPVLGRNLMLAVDLSGSMEADDMVIGNRQL